MTKRRNRGKNEIQWMKMEGLEKRGERSNNDNNDRDKRRKKR